MEPLLQVHNLTVGYGRDGARRLLAVRDMSFGIAPGEAVGLLGESGCGKTTLALSLLRLLPPSGRVLGGSIIFRGTDLLRLRERELQRVRGAGISMVYQEPGMALNPVLRVGAQVAEVLRAHEPLSRRHTRAEVKGLLAQVGFSEGSRIEEAYPHQLSGGQRQRVVIAQAIAGRPSLLVADEPTTALDAVIQMEILGLLKSLKERLQLALLLITHDPGVLAQLAERVMVMYAGRLVEEGPAQQVFQNPLHPYTRGLLQSGLMRRSGENRKQPLHTIGGEAPDLARLPWGCVFEPRCPDRMDVCRTREPEEYNPETSRRVCCMKYGH
jgi:peptide/nickel transport system ATP-binding protein